MKTRIENQESSNEEREMNDEPELNCPKCRRFLPATTEYWHKSTLYKSGRFEAACKECRNRSRVARKHKKMALAGKTVRQYRRNREDSIQIPARKINRPEIPFEQVCLNDHVRRVKAPILSIDKTI